MQLRTTFDSDIARDLSWTQRAKREVVTAMLATSLAAAAMAVSPTTTCARQTDLLPTGRSSRLTTKNIGDAWSDLPDSTPDPVRVSLQSTTSAPNAIVRRLSMVENMRLTAEQLRRQLAGLSGLPAGWNTYSARAIDGRIVESAAASILDHLIDAQVPPDRVIPSPAGGVVLSFGRGPRKADLEFFVDGEVLLVLHDGASADIREVDAVDQNDISKGIRDWLRS